MPYPPQQQPYGGGPYGAPPHSPPSQYGGGYPGGMPMPPQVNSANTYILNTHVHTPAHTRSPPSRYVVDTLFSSPNRMSKQALIHTQARQDAHTHSSLAAANMATDAHTARTLTLTRHRALTLLNYLIFFPFHFIQLTYSISHPMQNWPSPPGQYPPSSYSPAGYPGYPPATSPSTGVCVCVYLSRV